jgi:predicted RNA-binding protein with PIN domain
MKLIIDGYNLIRSVIHRQAKQPDVQQFLGRLRRYQRVTEHEITVVFDGGDGTHRYQIGYHGLIIWYSGQRETADDLIKDFLTTVQPDSVVLISDDRQLNAAAQERDIVSVSPLFFISRLTEREGIKPTKPQQQIHGIIKTSENSSDELDALMIAYSGSLPQKENERLGTVVPKHKKGSKLERRLEALIRKL